MTHRSAPARRTRLVAIAFLLPAASVLQAAVPAPATCSHPPGSVKSCSFSGRPLAEALGELRARGLNLIFSSDLVSPDLVVASEPPATVPREILDQLLAPFGLAAVEGPAGTILVVRRGLPESRGKDTVDGSGPARRELPLPVQPLLRERVRVRAAPDRGPGPVTTLGQEEIGHVPAIGDDALRALDWLPGIDSGDSTARFGVRGGPADEALIRLDGMEIDEPYHLRDFLAFSSILDARAIGRMDVQTGIFPAEYGDRMGGVVDMTTTEASGAARTVVGASLVNTSILSSGGLGPDASWLVSARTWRPDRALDTVILNGDGINPTYNDLLGKFQVRLPGGSLLSAHVLASWDELRYRTDLGEGRARAKDNRRQAWISWKMPWTPRLFSDTLISRSGTGRERIGGTVDGRDGASQVDDGRSSISLGLKQDWMFVAAEDALLKWGVDARRLDAEYADRTHVEHLDPLGGSLGFPSPAAPVIFDRHLALEPSGSEIGAYLSGRFRVFGPLTAELGVRRDRQTLTGQAKTSPRVNLSWDLGRRDVLRAGWGIFHQAEGIDELQIEDGVVRFFPAERSEQSELDFEHRFEDGLTLGASAYLRTMSSLRPRYENLFNPYQLFPETEPDRVRVAPDAAMARGVELSLGTDRGRALSWRAAYALATAQDSIGDRWVARSGDQRHTVNFTWTYRIAERWEIELAGVYHSGWPTTEVQAEQVREADGSLVIQPILGPRNAQRYPPYHRLDLGVTRRFRIGGGSLGLRFQVTNLYGRGNVCCVSELRYLPQPDGSVRVDRLDGHWRRQLPVFAMTYEF